MNSELNIVFLTDIHGAAHNLPRIEKELQWAHMVIISGDITHFGVRRDVDAIISSIEKINSNILAVSGNCDYPEIEEYLTNKGIGIHRKVIQKLGYTFVGLGGSLPCPGTTPNEYTDTEAEAMLAEIDTSLSNEPLILLTHQPPYNTLNDQLSTGQHVGSKAIRNFIQNNKPLLCLTGHIHEGIGIDNIGQCKVVNPGPFRNAQYAIITISGENSVNIALKQLTD